MDSVNIHQKPQASRRKLKRTIFAHPIERAHYEDEILYPRKYEGSANDKYYSQTPKYKYIMALLIAAHNEEMVLANTLLSAIAAGIDPQHIYVVDDASTDATSTIAKAIIGDSNVIKVRHSGKGLALTKAAKKFNLPGRYRWIHIADADGAFSPDYFRTMRGKLRVKYAAATGYVRSLSGSYIGQYRVFEYTIGLDFMRRFQAMTHVVSVIPGPTSCFRSDVFEKINFANHSLTEDFDVTLQIHRQKLGNIQFIPQAIAYTQDPKSLKDYIKQITRWNRGTMQGVLRHKIGRRASRIDAYLGWQLIQNLLFFFNYLVWLPLLVIRGGRSISIIASAILFDIAFTWLMVMYAAYRSRRSDIISAFPFIYVLRWISIGVFLKCFVEVGILRKHRVSKGVWSTAGRRYKIDTTPVLSEA
jgi:cellulose synthase/poly-beta-1,6-N-acetylglucosamine synthase-like glycosyltransferase